ncbi:hypothetical protein CLOACE_16460 [Clostridium acetireducens DSM 10703]|jgi:hypothetical protein|uniref:PsbP C-terminal domain-containing protein n=1 Tax=Clostridium acetireducens DSM 10703 TaxID=1121290 RepID=A0A1E8EXH3_9CLOT|nr:hypothetical protein [Clostridium acetireducens]OFI05488.1 hypothetical protein CLOACE_16460 [Clostridium acetireducens DSM 10703]
MKFLVLNKKRLSIVLIIIGLIIILIGIQSNFQERLNYTSLIQNNINSLKEYEALNKKFKYKLPEEWITDEKVFSGEEIIYHNDFHSKDLSIHGFVQVWNLKKDLKIYLEESKEISEMQNECMDYSLSEIKIKNNKAYLVQYNMITSKNKKYKSYEYFIKNKNKFFRFSFFVEEKNFKENMPTVFTTIVNTFNYNE